MRGISTLKYQLMSVLSYLRSLGSALTLSCDERASIATSINTLQARLNAFDTQNDIKYHYKFGSYDRGTILPRRYDAHSDVDYMIVFKDPFKAQPQSRLNWIKRFANGKYQRSEIHQDYPTIVLELNHIRFELVPAVEMGSSINLQIPAPHNILLSWIYTNPNQFLDATQQANKRYHSEFKPLVRILKYWNVLNGRPYSSCILEYHLATTWLFGINLEDYFYSAVRNLPSSNLSEQELAAVNSLKQKVAKIKNYHEVNSEGMAEQLVRELFQ